MFNEFRQYRQYRARAIRVCLEGGVVVRRGSWIYFDSGCGHAFYMRSNGFELLGFSV